jgi:hypothetical protein
MIPGKELMQGRGAQVVERLPSKLEGLSSNYLPSKLEALSSNHSTAKKKKMKVMQFSFVVLAGLESFFFLIL